MSSKQTDSRKGSVQVPEGWSPTFHVENGKPPQPTGGENESLQTLEESITSEVSSQGSMTKVTKEPENGTDTDGTIGAILPKESHDTADSLQTGLSEQREQAMSAINIPQTNSKRTGNRQRKESLEEYRQAFLSVPKLEDRKPVFISREVRDRLDEIARKLGGRGMSVSGFIENLARHHLETYRDELEMWKKL